MIFADEDVLNAIRHSLARLRWPSTHRRPLLSLVALARQFDAKIPGQTIQLEQDRPLSFQNNCSMGKIARKQGNGHVQPKWKKQILLDDRS
jgi:hypothetical protein